jgi:AcrR family transcriptional regulator
MLSNWYGCTMTDVPVRPPRSSSSPARRKNATDRRAELIGIGLRLLVDTPIHELSIDRVAEEAGISRTLLFHYFANKTDFYASVVEAAARRMSKQAHDPETGTSTERLLAITTGFVAFIRRRTRNYVALVRGAAGGDERIAAAVRDTRAELTKRILAAAGLKTPTAWQALTVRGWMAMAEEMAIESAAMSLPVEQLVERLVEQLRAVLKVPRQQGV